MKPHLHAERRTLAQPVDITGIGLHTGQPARLRLHPSQNGLLLRKGASVFPVRWDYVRDTHRAVALGNGEFTLGTVEHLLAALWGLGITDCVIEVLEGNEVPILDGSALPFMELIGSPVALDSPLPAVCMPVLEPVWAQRGDRVVGVLPGHLYAFGYIHFPEPLGVQAGCFDLRLFREQIAPARTFGFLHEVESLRQQGLARGGSLENVLLIAPDGYYNSARFVDEPLRHKILDVIGDLMLCGANLCDFALVAIKPGHSLDVELAQALAQRLPQWRTWMEAHDGGMDA
ncbi:MAG: UDP-3-O-acyl-N-acetylglucosamine deacetylase [Armatimonadota bacterium]